MTFDSERKFAAREMNMPMDQFWSMTYAEFHEQADGFVKSRRDRINEQLFVAFRAEWLARQKEVELNDFLLSDKKEQPERRKMTPDEIMAKCRLINAMLGGTEVIV